jgi:hypothetical protein
MIVVSSKMTWKLTHNNETVGEWSDNLVEAIATKLKSKSEGVAKKEEQINMIAEFLPDPIRDAIS